jgi:hypothetical protein
MIITIFVRLFIITTQNIQFPSCCIRVPQYVCIYFFTSTMRSAWLTCIVPRLPLLIPNIFLTSFNTSTRVCHKLFNSPALSDHWSKKKTSVFFFALHCFKNAPNTFPLQRLITTSRTCRLSQRRFTNIQVFCVIIPCRLVNRQNPHVSQWIAEPSSTQWTLRPEDNCTTSPRDVDQITRR